MIDLIPFALCVASLTAPPATPRAALDEREIAVLIAQLGHADFKVRESATKKLIDAGEPVRAALEREAARKGLDPEAAQRIALVLEALWAPKGLASFPVREKGLLIQLVPAKGAFREGEAVSFTVRLTNLGGEAVYLYDVGYAPLFVLKVGDWEARYTPKVSRKRPEVANSRFLERGESTVVPLKVEAPTWQWVWTGEVAKPVMPRAALPAGHYQARVSAKFADSPVKADWSHKHWTGDMASGEVTVRVGEPAEGPAHPQGVGTGTIAGTAVGPDGKPTLGAVVLVYGMLPKDDPRRQHAANDIVAAGRTDATGRFRIEGVPCGEGVALNISSATGGRGTKDAITVTAGQTADVGEVRLVPNPPAYRH